MTYLQKSWSKIVIIFLLLVTFFITAKSVLNNGLMLGHDSYAHSTYAKLFVNALEEGQFPVRWVEHVWIGFGQPLFNHYQVGFYYFIFLLNLLPINFLFSLNLSVFVLWWMGGTFVYLLARKYGRLSGFLSLIIYLFSPYLILDIFIRNAYPEFMAVSLIPALFWITEKVINKPRILTIGIFAIFLSLIIISHLPTLIIFGPILGGFTLLQVLQKGNKRRSLIYLTLGGVLGIGIAAFYLLPAIFDLNLIQIQKMQSGIFNFKRHFIDPVNINSYLWGYGDRWWGNNFPLSNLVGIIQWIVVTLTIVYLVYKLFNSQFKMYLKNNLEIFFWSGVIVYCFFFMQRVSSPVWETFSFLQFIQYPWRFFMLIPLATALLGGIMLSRISTYNYRCLIVLCIFLGNLIFVAPFLGPIDLLKAEYFNLGFSDWKNNEVVKKVAFVEPAYSPKQEIVMPGKYDFEDVITASDNTLIKKEVVKNNQLSIIIDSPEPSFVTLNTPYYSGWKAKINDNDVSILPSDKFNFMKVEVPAGINKVEFKMAATPTAKISIM